jgi:hypothetical protein
MKQLRSRSSVSRSTSFVACPDITVSHRTSQIHIKTATRGSAKHSSNGQSDVIRCNEARYFARNGNAQLVQNTSQLSACRAHASSPEFFLAAGVEGHC